MKKKGKWSKHYQFTNRCTHLLFKKENERPATSQTFQAFWAQLDQIIDFILVRLF